MWRIPAGLAWCWSDDEASTFVTSVALGRVVVLSDTAGAIWRTADRASTMGEIISRLGADLGLDQDAIASDVELCVTELVEVGLLENKGDTR